MRTRKLYNLSQATVPGAKSRMWSVGFGYYDEHGNFTGDSEETILSEDELYECLRPKLLEVHRPKR